MTDQEILAKVEEIRLKREAAIAAAQFAEGKHAEYEDASDKAAQAASALFEAEREFAGAVMPMDDNVALYRHARRRSARA